MKLRSYRLNRNGNSTNFFSYVCNGKTINELFASTLNGIAASVSCVSSMIVALNAKLSDLLWRMRTKKDGEKRRSPTKVLFFC